MIEKCTPQQRKEEADQLARECLNVRKRFLFTQLKLAEALGVSRRTVQMIEAGYTLPHMSTRQKFRDLQEALAMRYRRIA
jgi:DNA-binding XRE family transcriptional regulator